MSATERAEIQWGVLSEVDGDERVELRSARADAYTRLGNLMRHHQRHEIVATRYAVVWRTIQVGPWEVDA